MKVLFIGPACSIHTQRWVMALAERDFEVVLVSLPNDKWEQRNDINKLKVIYLPISGKQGYYLNWLDLKKISKKVNADVINVHYASGYGTLARVAGLPNTVVSVWGSDVYEFPYQNKIQGIILRKNLNAAKYIGSTSYCMAEQTNKVMGKDMHCTVTPFGVDTQLFSPNPKKIDSNKFIFGIVKTLSTKYGINDLIDAYAFFVKENPGSENTTELHIYGDGEDKEKLKRQADETGLPGIIFGGKIPNKTVPDVLNQFDVFCCSSSSSSESFGVAAVEAMACGLPVIATDVDGFMEVVVDNETGLIVPRRNAKAMAEKMSFLYQNKDTRKKMGQNGRERVLAKYKWDDNVTTMIDLYKRAMSEK